MVTEEMALILSSFLLLFSLGVSAEVQLLQSQSVSVQYGGQVRISCSASGYQFTEYWLAWLKQAPRKEPEYMGEIYPSSGGTYFTESFKGRFTFSTDNSNNMAYLDIGDVQIEDAAVYYCSTRIYIYAVDIWEAGLIFGNGTQLIVLPNDKPPTAPDVFELRADNGKPYIACLAKDFFPKDVDIYIDEDKQENFSSVLSKEGLYSAVTVQNVKSDDFTCKVQQNQNIRTSKDIKKPSKQKDDTETQCEQTDGIGAHSNEQINLLSLTVLGMRVLFAKTLVFNLLLSAKIFIM